MVRKRATLSDLLNDLTFRTIYDKFRLIAVNMYEWENLPAGIEARHIENLLFEHGKAIFFRDPSKSYMCLQAQPAENYNVYGEPLKWWAVGFGYRERYTQKNSVIINNNPLRLCTHDFLMFYVNKITEAERTMDVNIKRCKTPYIFACNDKDVLSVKQIFEKIDGNVPAIYTDRALNLETLQVLQTGVTFLGDKLQDYKNSVESELLTFLGQNNNPVDKKERLITDEAQSNNQLIASFADLGLTARQEACDKINKCGSYRRRSRSRCAVWKTLLKMLKTRSEVTTMYDRFFPFTGDTTRVTIELRDIVTGDNPVDIWAFDYPSYYQGDEKAAFEKKVIDHYYFRQIGQETVGRWLHLFRARIREIMPYYLQMYKSVEIMNKIEDPFGNVDVTETFEQTETGDRTGNTTGKTTANQTSSVESETDYTDTDTHTTTDDTSERVSDTINETDTRNESAAKEHRYSNTPSTSIDSLDDYLTEASRDNDTIEGSNQHTGNNSRTATAEGEHTTIGTTTRTGTEATTGTGNSVTDTEGTTTEQSNNTIKHTLTRKGNQGVNTYAHDMIEFRQSFIDVDMMIINNLQDLFLMVY